MSAINILRIIHFI